MRVLSEPRWPEGGRSRRKESPVPESAARLGLLERTTRAVNDMQTYYANMLVEDWGQLPEPAKMFLQACGMGQIEGAKQAAAELARELDAGTIRPAEVPLPIRKAVAQIV